MPKHKRHQENKPTTNHPHQVSYQENFEGPLPHPMHLEYYEQISPGTARKIIAMTENQAKHRQFLEKEVVMSNISNERRGMNYAFIITLTMMVIGAILIYNDKAIAGYISLFTPVVIVAGIFYKKRSETKP